MNHPSMRLERVRLVTSARVVDTRALSLEFPTVTVERAHAACVDEVVIDADKWRTASRFGRFDEAFGRSTGNAIIVRGDYNVEYVACEALTRYQRFILRGNESSRSKAFAAILSAHHHLHEASKPLVQADLDHALDTWQWMLRLDANAGLAPQLAALFKNAHPGSALWPTFDVLSVAVGDQDIAKRVRDIVTSHEREGESSNRSRGRDAAVDLLSDADALSFLSLSSSSYLDYFGPVQTRRKLVSTLARLGDVARTKLSLMRLRPDVRSLFRVAA